ncbi:hypothetical protein POSPLADRAFT_1071881 [Postia placenta MAD-698-R-SB12]|uniref:Uncharacterized protein n=1 Tax=Postia placenta MAD-698-R-SB12 TaxID=670580 RepID=A0A1X6MK89_9APHY|nr:hypothetical protein POSPLADRAFT_1071881 [Postia placenta MAD-698-R-SB12]OSX56666.1 hypothetical protein POSPLADRAFT_1071881 [Postia placenta MAD-698-R-SB12]
MDMDQPPEYASRLPSTSTFSFTAPFPPPSEASSSNVASALKQRRVSLATNSSPRIVPAWSFRDDTGVGVHSIDSSGLAPEKKGKMRRIESSIDRTDEEGALQPSTEKKPRKKWTMEETQMLVNGCNKARQRACMQFRTYFPDAYKQHYPNAKTHLSSKIRSALPDGSSIFEKTRSKKRRPFTEEEDRALKAGYDKHGTVWATIVKDPIFQEQNRRSTDLRDRFRNAFPDLYQAAGYKPRASTKKKRGEAPQPVRAATDDQLAPVSSSGQAQRKRRHTTQGLFRGGTKSVPESATNSEDEDSSDGEDDTPASTSKDGVQSVPRDEMTPASDYPAEMDMQTVDPLAIPDFIPGSSFSEMTDSSQSQNWSTVLETPLNAGAWSSAANAASPTSSHLSSDYFLNNSPFHRQGSGTMIGKSAWGPQDWLSANPRLDPSGATSSNSSYVGGVSPAPSSPFSFAHLNHGVLDRYDLFPPSLAHDFASEAGVGDTHSTFSDPDIFSSSSFRGFTHHSNYAGDLIFGARSHQPQHQPFDYGPGFGFGNAGLGLSGVQPMQLHTPALPGIDEIELTSITLEDQGDIRHPLEEAADTAVLKDDGGAGMTLSELGAFGVSPQTLEDIVGFSSELHATPPGTPQSTSRSMRAHSAMHVGSSHNRSISVPPSEHRVAVTRAAQTQVMKTRPLQPPPRSMSLMEMLPVQPADTMASQPQTFQSLQAYATEGWRQQADMYDLPFLDLHYYTSTNNPPATMPVDPNSVFAKPDADILRQGQALDLAETYPNASRTFGLPPSLTQHIPMMSQSASSTPPATTRMLPSHHRGQSAVSPQDLLLRKSSDNKRKRSSWDGGVH